MENFLEDYSRLLDYSKNHLSNATIATYINLKEQLSNKELKFIDRHLQDCSDCKSKFETIRAEDIEIDSGHTDKIKIFSITKYWKYAAAAGIVIGVLAAIYFYFPKQSENLITEDILTKDTLSTEEKATPDSIIQSTQEGEKLPKKEKKPDQELFAVNNVLENFINRNVRSENKIFIISPELSDTVHAPITFKWKATTTVKDLKLILVDNKNIITYLVSVAGNELTMDKKLNDGLYYWKLEADGTLETVGKIFVIN